MYIIYIVHTIEAMYEYKAHSGFLGFADGREVKAVRTIWIKHFIRGMHGDARDT